MKMKKHLVASLAVATTIGFFTPLTSQAFGLGKLELMSALNEPFKAEIDITALRAEEKDNLQVQIASHEEFEKAGLDRSFMLSQLQFDIVQRAGQTKVLVTSKDAVKEPFLDFLLTATAGSGRLIREYTVLLDPPKYVMAETRPASVQPAPEASPAVETSAPSSSTSTSYQYADSATSSDSYKVKRNDTLWNVALNTRPNSSVSVHQMMMALLNENRSAFTNENVNGLKAGVTLQIPSQAEIQAMSQSAAAAAFADQNEAWKNRNQPTVDTVTETVAEPESTAVTEQSSDAAETVSTDEALDSTSETAAGDEAVTDEARLQLVAPEDTGTSEDDASPNVAGNDQITQLSEQLTLAQETIEAQTQENVDFKARMDAMEEQLETMRRLISLKDADLARLQSMLEEEDPALAAEVKAELQSEQLADQMPAQEADESSVETVATEAAEGSAEDTEQAQVSPETTEMPAETVTEQQADSIINDAATALNLDQQEVQSVVDKVKQFVNDNKLETALGLLLVLLILWLIARRSNREVTWDEAVKKMDKDAPEESGAVVVEPVTNEEEVTDAPLAAATEEKTVAELIEQADMFIGYADYVQAKNSLEQARLQEPENSLVAYKILFVLYKQNLVDDFVALAEEAQLDKDSFEWTEVKQWGSELAPNHSLFADASEATDLAGDDLAEPVISDEPDAAADDLPAVDIDEPVTAEADTNIEFDMSEFETDATSEPETEVEQDSEAAPAKDDDDDLLSFDANFSSAEKSEDSLDLDANNNDEVDETLSFDLDATETSEQLDGNELDESASNEDDAPDLEFDVGDLDDIDEAETKLDLAAAYIDMGDPDGAKSILNEVLVEGSEEQKNRAHSLLENLS
jgi:pilus assembly protein FimV